MNKKKIINNLLNMNEIINKHNYFGSDNSYDLLVEVLELERSSTERIELNCLNPAIKTKCIENLELVKKELAKSLDQFPYKIKITVFNKLPIHFVWLGRIEAALNIINKK
ncbi:hypothetical protein QU600_001840 [Orientia tsutsugamushi]|uniref:hypothetical protein n=1 Tax=Orientia tsutsugamushi TaxID=784 RepID=UPI00315CCDA0